jgi:hypothetical protein
MVYTVSQNKLSECLTSAGKKPDSIFGLRPYGKPEAAGLAGAGLFSW